MPDPKRQANWQPISNLPLIASLVDGTLEDTQEQHQLFLDAVPKPHVLDDYTVQRAQRLCQAQLDDLWFFEEQCRRWSNQQLSSTQHQEVKRIVAQIGRIRELSQTILGLLAEIRKGTIDRIMEKSDLELGIEFLLRQQGQQPDD